MYLIVYEADCLGFIADPFKHERPFTVNTQY